MPAYLVGIKQMCEWTACRSTATVELRNTHNATVGSYCNRHGKKTLDEFERKLTT